MFKCCGRLKYNISQEQLTDESAVYLTGYSTMSGLDGENTKPVTTGKETDSFLILRYMCWSVSPLNRSFDWVKCIFHVLLDGSKSESIIKLILSSLRGLFMKWALV